MLEPRLCRCVCQVRLELLLTFLVGAVGSSLWSGAFHAVSASASFRLRSYDTLTQHSDFETFSHRGRALQHSSQTAVEHAAKAQLL